MKKASMRALAAKLGVEAMSLYNHVTNEDDDVLNGIVDLVVGEIDVPAGGSDWRAARWQRRCGWQRQGRGHSSSRGAGTRVTLPLAP